MIIKEKNAGAKIPYEVNGSKVTLDDELMLNLTKYERDDQTHIDVCFDPFGCLVVGAITGSSYVAEIDIPARRYTQETTVVQEGDEEREQSASIPVPLDMDTVTLTLWAIDE